MSNLRTLTRQNGPYKKHTHIHNSTKTCRTKTSHCKAYYIYVLSTLNIYHNVILQIRSLKELMPTRYFAVYIRIKKGCLRSVVITMRDSNYFYNKHDLPLSCEFRASRQHANSTRMFRTWFKLSLNGNWWYWQVVCILTNSS